MAQMSNRGDKRQYTCVNCGETYTATVGEFNECPKCHACMYWIPYDLSKEALEAIKKYAEHPNEQEPHSYKFYHSVEPIMKSVTRQEFIDFIDKYPRKLDRDVCGISDPPNVTYNDFELADRWPYSIVAQTYLYDNDPSGYFYKPEAERYYGIMINYEEVFASKTGRMADE